MVLQVVGDESGSDGENLSQATHRMFSYGSTSLSRDDASEILRRTRRAIGSTSEEAVASSELKSSKLFAKHRKVAESLFEPNGPFDGQASVYIADKTKFLAGKMVSLLLEEHQYRLREPLGFEKEAVLANEIADYALPVLPDATRSRLLQTFNQLCRSYKAPYAPSGRASKFLDALRFAIVSASHDPRASKTLNWLWEARREAYTIENEQVSTRDLEPMLPTLLVVATTWHEHFGGPEFEIHMDEYRQMTPQMIDIVKGLARGGWGVPLKDIIQVQSLDDPRVQVADWIAGAGRIAATEILRGEFSRLSELVLPFIDESSMRSPNSALEGWIAGV
ncbi:DUF3800 domain-containing protein [Curtobacterium flaccumfaciens]|uniref:DUF3800 domain-containing protein n=1 Tax=Curtobacterium flaccumfaciens TaxID=2035 RepID=UPI001BDE6968|nr:DUF3800 domain-containing protein [Curtobacterium flaccumfaciens]MBT1631035.1 DUF3800 domain-containing protein [Curtobacterium flaccumfaciens pv. oortii]MCX2845083.1 DUF3800 domain-containing protein [Curtobacterium flaccumfaciens pv. oortii]